MRWVGVLMLAGFAPAARAAEVDFNRDVRPILAARCFKCHGPDDGARRAKLRLDSLEGATTGGQSGEPAVVPGKPDKSELVRRVLATDEKEQMPPAALKNPLSDREKAILKEWVAAGAKYDPHWAFVPPKRPAPPLSR